MLQEDPKHIAALERLADVYAHEGNAQLPTIIDRLRGIDPQNLKALYHFATILFYQERFDEAIQVVKRILQHEPNNMRARIQFNMSASTQTESAAAW